MLLDQYLDGLKLYTDQRRHAIRQLVGILRPLRKHWWQFWRYSDRDRYLLAFALVTFMTEARS